jgi:mannose-6-phosphate isomerase
MEIPEIILLPPNRVWRTYTGGRELDLLEGKLQQTDTHFPEDWIASTTRAINKGREEYANDGHSKVFIDHNEYLLKELFKNYPNEILGPDHYQKYGPNTQFLCKFLDAAIRLHIQAHPTIDFAEKHLNSHFGKTEAYIILSSREEIDTPYIYLGFQKPLSKIDFKNAVLNQQNDKILSCFEKIPVQNGDIFIVPGGLPHAIGEGVFMIEIMEPTDFAIRLEFERGGYVLPEESRYMGRDIDFALSMIDFSPFSTEEIKSRYFLLPREIQKQKQSTEYSLISKEHTSCFSVNRCIVKGNYSKKENSFFVCIVTKGSGRIKTANNVIDIKTGHKLFIPYMTKEIQFSSQDEMHILSIFPPP